MSLMDDARIAATEADIVVQDILNVLDKRGPSLNATLNAIAERITPHVGGAWIVACNRMVLDDNTEFIATSLAMGQSVAKHLNLYASAIRIAIATGYAMAHDDIQNERVRA